LQDLPRVPPGREWDLEWFDGRVKPDAVAPGCPNLSDLFPGNGERHHTLSSATTMQNASPVGYVMIAATSQPDDAVLPDVALG
jgi:hypothetical protein